MSPHIHINGIDSNGFEMTGTETDAAAMEGREKGINRQCAIGWHDECSDPDGDECKCVCHVEGGAETRPAVTHLPHRGPRAFLLIRDEDETGISGTGIVAEGIEFSDGRVAMRWQTHSAHRSTVTWDSIEDVTAIHGHNGRTWIQFADDIAWPPADEGRPANTTEDVEGPPKPDITKPEGSDG